MMGYWGLLKFSACLLTPVCFVLCSFGAGFGSFDFGCCSLSGYTSAPPCMRSCICECIAVRSVAFMVVAECELVAAECEG